MIPRKNQMVEALHGRAKRVLGEPYHHAEFDTGDNNDHHPP